MALIPHHERVDFEKKKFDSSATRIGPETVPITAMAMNRALMPGSRKGTVVSCLTTASSLRSGTLKAALQKKKALLLDQFGVLHDGKNLYPGVQEAIEYLHEELGLRILIVSNSSRRSNGALKNLEKKGINVKLIEGAITSGEVTTLAFTAMPREEAFRGLRRCVHFTWGSRGAISLDGLDLEVVGDASTADFILAHGTEAIGTNEGPCSCSLDEMKQLLEQAAAHRLPMIVANPDLVTVDGSRLVTMPGTLAKHYEDLEGGIVYRMGKPDRRIYVEALSMLGLEPSEVMAIGDSMEHDIAGAAAMGIDSIFIAGGIHRDVAMVKVDGDDGRDQLIDEDGVASLCAEFQCCPSFVLPSMKL